MPAMTPTACPSDVGVYALPRECYLSPAWFGRELESLFRPGWIFAGHVSEVAEAGQYLRLDWRDESVVVLRTDAGELVAHHNVCRHRGFRLFGDRRGKVKKTIVCGYHGWCYEQTGKLLAASRMPLNMDFDKSLWGLKPVWLDEWKGMLFVSFSG
jgi:phenylpropionate dioxygenase-like ring-hydroxylating dioxygenase large terminal subunit